MKVDIKRYCERRIEPLQHRIAKFQDAFTQDPAYALSWSNSTFRDAAALRVYNQILDAVNSNEKLSLDAVLSTMLDRVLNKSKFPSQSTSPTSNLIEQYELSVCSEIYSDLSGYEE